MLQGFEPLFAYCSTEVHFIPPIKKTGLVPVFFIGYESSFELLLVALLRMEFASKPKAILLARVAVAMLIFARKCISDLFVRTSARGFATNGVRKQA